MTNAFDWRKPREEEKMKEEKPLRTQAVFEFTKHKYPYDITGFKFGRLTCVSRDDKGRKHISWTCLCDCGNKVTVRSDNLKSGAVKSCGCLRVESSLKNLPN